MHERGEGCEQNIVKALEFYKKAWKLGDKLGEKNYKLVIRQIKEGKYKI